jgi:hypothetical protein
MTPTQPPNIDIPAIGEFFDFYYHLGIVPQIFLVFGITEE